MLLFFWLYVALGAWGQEESGYYVFFKDKVEGDFCPGEQFSPKAILRRERQQISWDKSDWPVNAIYIAGVGQEVNEIRYRLRWLNALSVQATPAQIEQVKKLTYVSRVEAFEGLFSLSPTAASLPSTRSDSSDVELDTLLTLQREQMQAERLREAGLNGQGVRIAVIDAGFKEAETHPALQHLWRKGQVIATRNFYKERQDVYTHSWHGLGVLGCIAGKYDDRWIGMAPEAEFLLARTEHKLWERTIEEDHWLAAAEWADSMGADIINSSLGYSKEYSYADMNGRSTRVSQAASMAASKGMLVITSVGNEGASKWHYMSSPGDNPDVLSVGGTLTFLPYRIRFSSYGPNSEGVMKPNVTAPAYVLLPRLGGKYGSGQGTSFSSPIVAGLAACLMQKHPEKSAAEIFALIEQMGHLYPYYDYAHGYGVPQAEKLFSSDTSSLSPTFTATFEEGKVSLLFAPEILADSLRHPYGRVLYYHFEKPDGTLDSFEHKMVPSHAKGYIFQYHHQAEGILRIWYAGYMLER